MRHLKHLFTSAILSFCDRVVHVCEGKKRTPDFYFIYFLQTHFTTWCLEMRVSFRTVTEYGMCIGTNPLYFFLLPLPRLSSVFQTAGMFQNIFYLFSIRGFTQGTGNTDWWLEYLQMATCTIISFKSLTMHGFIKRQYVLMLKMLTRCEQLVKMGMIHDY